MATLREVFVNWQIKSNLAAEMKKLDDAIEETSDEFKEMADAAEKSAKETAEAWGKVGDRMKGVGQSIATGIGVGVTALVGAATAAGAFVTQWAHGATEIETTAKRVGISAQSLQEWQFAARASGGEAEGIAGIFKELNNRLAEVGETGTGSAADALTLLKLRVEDLRRLKPEQQMEQIADRLSMISDVGARTFIKDSLFGGEYEKIGSLLEQGAVGIATLRKEAQSLGGVLDGAALEGAKNFNKELTKTEAIVDGVKSTVAKSMLPVLRDLVHRFGEWVAKNRELIATKAEEWAQRIAGWFEKIVPLAGNVVDMIGKITDGVGGLDNAVKLAAGGWAAYQVAALAALGPVGAAVAGITASLLAVIALADRYAGDPEKLAATKGRLSASKEALRLQQRALEESGKDDTFDPAIDDARRRFRRAAVTAAQEARGASTEDQVRINSQLKAYETALDAAYEADRLHAAEVEANSAMAGTLGKIAKPGGEKPLTTEGLLREQRKREAELEKLRKIRADLESRRMNAQGIERMTIERTLADVNKRLTGQDMQTPEQLIAGLVGQGTNLGLGALRPAGLGTSINQIDARIIFNVGGIDVEMPASAIEPGDPRASGQSFGQSIAEQFTQWIGQASQLQRGVING